MLGYSSNSKAYRVFNKNSGLVEERHDVQFDETNGSQEEQENLDDVGNEALRKAMEHMQIGDIKPEDDPSPSTQVEAQTSSTNQIQIDEEENVEDDQPSNLPPRIHNAIAKDHPIDQILGDVSKGVQTRCRVASFCEHYYFVSFI